MWKHCLSGSLALLLLSSLACADGATARVKLDNLVPYTNPMAGWSDRHSNVVLTWQQEREPGLQRLLSLVGWAGTEITTKFLSWNLAEDGKPLALKFKSLNFRPDKVVEIDTAEGLELTATAAWPGRNTLAMESVLTNQTDKPRNVELSFNYPGKGQPPTWKGPFPAKTFVSLENETEGSWATLYVHNEHGRNVPSGPRFRGRNDGRHYAGTRVHSRSVEAKTAIGTEGQRAACDSAGLRSFSGRGPRWRDAAVRRSPRAGLRRRRPTHSGSCLARPRRWPRNIAAGKIRADVRPCDYRFKQPLYSRRRRIHRHEADSLHHEKHPGNRLLLGYLVFLCGAARFDPAAAQEAISCFTENAGPRGSLPGTFCDSHRAGEGQAPIMSWAAWLTYQRSHDKNWLGRVYHGLAGNNRFWFKYHASPRGLCQFFNAGQIADNDARFDLIQGTATGNAPLRLRIARSQFLPDNGLPLPGQHGRRTGVAGRRKDLRGADRPGRKIVETMYFPGEAMFFDVKTGTHEKLSGMKTPNMFLPLWAGTPLTKEQIAPIIERHMLNPKEFYRDLPFPSLSYDNRLYDPEGYWRGRIWPHVVYWMTQAMWRQGYSKEAEQTADRLLAMFEKTPWLHENYESAHGGGIGWRTTTGIARPRSNCSSNAIKNRCRNAWF